MYKRIILLLFLLTIIFGTSAKASESIDQSCSSAPTGKVPIGGGGYVIYQSFKPTLDFLNGISVLLHTDGIGEAKLSVFSSGKILAQKVLPEQSGEGQKEYYFNFNPIGVVKGQEYSFVVESTEKENEIISWYYVRDEDGNCYLDGAITDGLEDQKADMRFATFGVNSVADPTENDANQSSIGNTGVENNTKSIPKGSVKNRESENKPDDQAPNIGNNNTELGTDEINQGVYSPEIKGESNQRDFASNSMKYLYYLGLAVLLAMVLFVISRKKKK